MLLDVKVKKVINLWNNKFLVACLSAGCLIGCGRVEQKQAILKDDGNQITLEVLPENRKFVEHFVTAIMASATSGAPLTMADLAAVVPVAESDSQVVASAFTDPLTLNCDPTALCAIAGQGESVSLKPVTTSPDLSNVSMGIKSSVTAAFRKPADLQHAQVCDVDGIYFSKYIFRKNLRAFAVDLSGAGVITLWLAGSDSVPEC